MEGGQFSFDSPQIAAHYDATAPRLIPGYGVILQQLPPLIATADSVLVIGCGTGHEIENLRKPGRTIVGVEPAEAMIQVAHQRIGNGGDVRLLHGDLSNLAPTDRFEAATCLFVSHFLADKVRLWQSIADRLEPGGTLVCADFVRPVADEELNEMREGWFEHLVEQGLPPAVVENEKAQFATKFRLQTLDETHRDLVTAGFANVELAGSWHWTHLFVARVS